MVVDGASPPRPRSATVLACRRQRSARAARRARHAGRFAGRVTNLNPRPQIFALLPLFAGALLVLFTSDRRPWLLLMLPILVAVWTNISMDRCARTIAGRTVPGRRSVRWTAGATLAAGSVPGAADAATRCSIHRVSGGDGRHALRLRAAALRIGTDQQPDHPQLRHRVVRQAGATDGQSYFGTSGGLPVAHRSAGRGPTARGRYCWASAYWACRPCGSSSGGAWRWRRCWRVWRAE